MRLLLSSPRGAPTMFLRGERGGAITVLYPGRPPVSVDPGPGPLNLRLDDVGREGVVVDLAIPGPVALRVDDQTLGLGAVPGFTPARRSCGRREGARATSWWCRGRSRCLRRLRAPTA